MLITRMMAARTCSLEVRSDIQMSSNASPSYSTPDRRHGRLKLEDSRFTKVLSLTEWPGESE